MDNTEATNKVFADLQRETAGWDAVRWTKEIVRSCERTKALLLAAPTSALPDMDYLRQRGVSVGEVIMGLGRLIPLVRGDDPL